VHRLSSRFGTADGARAGRADQTRPIEIAICKWRQLEV
jgi:hypothetical protein